MHNNKISTIFVDKITPYSLLCISAFYRSALTIWHFVPLAGSEQRLLRLFRLLGLIRADVRQIEHDIGHVRNEDGDIDIFRFRGYARIISAKIKREQLITNPLIKAMSSEWAFDKILLYFDKLVEQEVSTECLRIGLVEWILRTQLRISPAQSILLIERKQWFSYLEDHARSQGIRLVAYRQLWDMGGIARAGSWILQAASKVLDVLLGVIGKHLRRLITLDSPHDSSKKQTGNQRSVESTIAIHYWHRILSFDPTERSEFFWINGSDIPYSEVLLYDYAADKPLDAKILEQISARGIQLMGRGPGIPVWLPTGHVFTVLFHTTLKLVFGIVSSLVHGRWVSPYFFSKFLALVADYSYWHDFFTSNRVRVNVGTLNTSVGQVLALNALNGVCASYQFSAGVIFSSPTLLTAGEDIQFVFSPVYEQLWRKTDAPVETIVQTGFIYDSAIQAVANLERVAETRKQLQDNGARFILCFFDENSMNRWDVFHSDDDAADDYEYLLKWLLEDPTLGFVFKPKNSATLFERIGRVSGLIEQARQTGRCKFLTTDTLVGSIYPAEAALMADLCLGWLSGGTACLEGRLAGVPAIFIDPAGFRSHPFHAWGHGRVVFEDWESLHAAVEQYRAAPEAHPEFGDWSPGLNDLDPFQDGQASLRMGLHIRWVYEALKQGASRQAAQAVAAQKFVQRWGSGHITLGS